MSVTSADQLLATMKAEPSSGCQKVEWSSEAEDRPDDETFDDRTLSTDENAQWQQIRTIRQGYLDATDWYLLDSNASKLQDESAFTTWRNDMLNLPQDYATPELALANWPTKPAWVV